MANFKYSFILLAILGYLCMVNANPISALFGKSSDNEETDDKTTTTTTTAAAAAKPGEATTTTTTPEPSSSCGGLKGFLHMCNKEPTTEPPKNIKTRSVPEKKDSDESDDDSDDSDDDDDEKTSKDKEETSSVAIEPMEGGLVKRQAEDPEEPPFVVAAPPAPEQEDPEDGETLKKRQTDDSDNTEAPEELSRVRRDCRDRYGDYEKDCRKKREYVPPCFGKRCTEENVPAPPEPEQNPEKVGDQTEAPEEITRVRRCSDRYDDRDKDCRKKRDYVLQCLGKDCKHNEPTESKQE